LRRRYCRNLAITPAEFLEEKIVSTALFYLALSILLSALLWIPYVIDRILKTGLIPVLGYPENPPAQSAWAIRLKKAHANGTENLVIFAAAVLSAHMAQLTDPLIASAAMSYFAARVVYTAAYTLAIPLLRTLAFTVGLLATLYIACQVVLAML
jgi:uncharacterized MAPEG superfamily protein